MRLARLIPILTLFGAAPPPAPTQGSDLALVAPVIASASDFKALLIAILVLIVLIVVPLISLLGYLIVRFLNASQATSSAMTLLGTTMARMESTQAAALARLDDTMEAALHDRPTRQ